MTKKHLIVTACALVPLLLAGHTAGAFWVWTPKSKKMINPKYAVKDTPREQYDYAMRLYKQNEFQRAADEFNRLTEYYPDSEFAPEAQYYAGRAYEELSKYYFAFKNYQKTVDNYPYTRRLDEIIKREYEIANIFQKEEEPKLMELELSLSIERAIEVYKKIVDNNPFGEYADKSLFKMAECYRRIRKYKEAIDAYERIINDYPNSDLGAEAKYQLAYTKYEASLDPEYDQESTDAALREFKQISRTTAVPKIAEEADKVLNELKIRKAESMLSIGQFYERQNKYRSALIYYKDVAGKFPGTPAAETARERIDVLKDKVKPR